MPIKIIRTSDMRGSKHKNTRRENRLEELGRVDAEKAYTSRGKRNLREEKDRIRSELATGGRPSMPDYKRTGPRRRPRDRMTPDQRRKFGPKTGGPKTGPQPPKEIAPLIPMGTTDYKDFMDQYKKHKRDKFIKDLKDHHKRRKPGDPPRVIDPKAPRPKKNRIMTPLGVKIKYSSGGAVMAGKKVGCQIK